MSIQEYVRWEISHSPFDSLNYLAQRSGFLKYFMRRYVFWQNQHAGGNLVHIVKRWGEVIHDWSRVGMSGINDMPAQMQDAETTAQVELLYSTHILSI